CSSSLAMFSGVESVGTIRTPSSAEGAVRTENKFQKFQNFWQIVRRSGRKAKCKLRVNAAKLQRDSHAVDRQHIGGDVVVHLVGFGIANHLVKGAFHHVQQALVDFAFAPEKALAILDPFEVADSDPAGVAENIRHGENALG